jgi:hypothetical protein
LLSLRARVTPAELSREAESLENEFRNGVRRHRDLIAVAVTADVIETMAQCARTRGFTDLHYEPVHYAQEALVAWQLRMRKAT